jgi:hypothetical protein
MLCLTTLASLAFLLPCPDTPGFEHVLAPKQAVKRIFSRAG